MGEGNEQRTITLPGGSEPASARLPRVGDVVADKYRIDAVLGQGGMGLVVAVTHLELNEPYAMKFLLPDATGNAEAVARFSREAKAAVRIKSEHVAQVSDVGQLPNGVPYIVMEYLTGQDLGDLLRQGGPLPIREAVDLLLQACVGVAEAHARGIVHRDLKPSNLFLTKRIDGSPLVKVLDFGISKATGDVGQAEITTSHAVLGSPSYMSPEQLKGARNADARSDIWSLGVILFKLLAGESPFEAETYASVIACILQDPPKHLTGLRPSVPPELEAIIVRCLEKDPAKRFQKVAELAVALEPFGSDASPVSVGRIVRLGTLDRTPSAQDLESQRNAAIAAAKDKRPSLNPTKGSWVSSAETVLELPAARPRRSRVLWIFAPVALVAAVAGFAFSRSSSAPRDGAKPTPATSASMVLPAEVPTTKTTASDPAAAPDAGAPVTTTPSTSAGPSPGTAPASASATKPKPAGGTKATPTKTPRRDPAEDSH